MSQNAAVDQVIDCRTPPKLERGWLIDSHIPMMVDPRTVKTIPCTLQSSRQTIDGEEMLRSIKRYQVLNAAMLEHYLKRPQDLPFSGTLFCLGTIYQSIDHVTGKLGGKYVRWIEGGEESTPKTGYRWIGASYHARECIGIIR